jgi:glycosyltransferase involved in cell wall biosynthesis
VVDEVDLFIAPSRSLAEEFVTLGLDSSKVRVSDYGFPPMPRPARAPSGTRLRIGFVGTLTWHKGAHILLDAIWRLPKDAFEVQIHGDTTSASLISECDRPMVEKEVRRLRDFPLIEIGAHSVHHLSLPEVTAEECHREVFESGSALERLTGQPVTSFAYPFGAVSPDAVTAVTAAGFEAAVSCEGRGLRAREHRLRIPRLAPREESGADLGARLARHL